LAGTSALLAGCGEADVVSGPPASLELTTLTLSGTLEVAWGDPDPGTAGPARAGYTLLDDAGSRHVLRLTGAQVRSLGGARSVGERIRVTGTAARSAAFVSVTQLEVLPGPRRASQPILGAQPFVTIGCRFADAVDETPAPMSYFDALMGNDWPGMDHYFRQLSYGAANLSGSVTTTWFNLPKTAAEYTSEDGSLARDTFFEDCTGAADASVYFPNFSGINLLHNRPFDGYSWGGRWKLKLDGVSKSFAVTWLTPEGQQNQAILGQEIGHGFTLPHSSGPYDTPYDSEWDVMSGGGACVIGSSFGCLGVHTIAYHKAWLGWLPAARVWTPSAAGTFRIALDAQGLASGQTGTLWLRIPTVEQGFLSVEARRRDFARADAYENDLPGEGVVLHDVDPTAPDRLAQVVDLTKNGNPNDPGAIFSPGEGYTEPHTGTRVEVVSRTDTGFLVDVTVPSHKLTVVLESTTPQATGVVRSSPSGIQCGGDCSEDYRATETVLLTAYPYEGTVLAEWAGCPEASGNVCRVPMGADRSVKARFACSADVCQSSCEDNCLASGKKPKLCVTFCASRCAACH
jgi:hypothetical protein